MIKYLYLAVVIIVAAVSLYCGNNFLKEQLDLLAPEKIEQISNNTK